MRALLVEMVIFVDVERVIILVRKVQRRPSLDVCFEVTAGKEVWRRLFQVNASARLRQRLYLLECIGQGNT